MKRILDLPKPVAFVPSGGRPWLDASGHASCHMGVRHPPGPAHRKLGRFGLRKTFNILSVHAALASPEALRELISAHVRYAFEDLVIPPFVTATAYLSGETVLLSTGNLWDSLLAGGALTFVFPPVLKHCTEVPRQGKARLK